MEIKVINLNVFKTYLTMVVKVLKSDQEISIKFESIRNFKSEIDWSMDSGIYNR